MKYIRFKYLQEEIVKKERSIVDILRNVIAVMSKFQTKILADLHALRKLPEAKEFFKQSNYLMQFVANQKSLEHIQSSQQAFIELCDKYREYTKELN